MSDRECSERERHSSRERRRRSRHRDRTPVDSGLKRQMSAMLSRLRALEGQVAARDTSPPVQRSEQPVSPSHRRRESNRRVTSPAPERPVSPAHCAGRSTTPPLPSRPPSIPHTYQAPCAGSEHVISEVNTPSSGVPIDVLIDSGSTISLISSSLLKHFECARKPSFRILKGLGSQEIESTSYVTLPIEFDGITLEVDMFVVASEYMNTPVIVGTDVLNREGVRYIRTRDSQLLKREITKSDQVMTVQSDVSIPINTPLVGEELKQLLAVINDFSQFFISGTATSTVNTGSADTEDEDPGATQPDKAVELGRGLPPPALAARLPVDDGQQPSTSGIQRHTSASATPAAEVYQEQEPAAESGPGLSMPLLD
ncbi:hypothetical protein HF086_009257 [Spodoptera exigua]|uniref:Peptidase A2 domain-containing protein n=1 Tax=Spodoptera exigua TaxID=7107 RepID=A0A922MDX0_SPOEX|nr:hypothetical protein HF086_009257 [Spodoptera exigua]